MRTCIRTLVGLLALAEGIAWTEFVMRLAQWRGPTAGAGDGAGTESPSGGEKLLGALLIGITWLLPVSPYLCMAGGAFNLLEGKSLRVAYVYALVVLALQRLPAPGVASLSQPASSERSGAAGRPRLCRASAPMSQSYAE